MNTLLTADAGSTKTDWRLDKADGQSLRLTTRGINPYMMNDNEIIGLLRDELLGDVKLGRQFAEATAIGFYGAGCRGAECERMVRLLRSLWPEAETVEVGSDIEGAAMALFGPQGSGIACILGTGSNSCLYLDGVVTANVSPLGYILGDEGSGAVLGRRLVGDVLKRQLPPLLCAEFVEATGLSTDQIIERVYRQSFPNRFLASLVPFISERVADEPSLQALVKDEFARFFVRNVALYGRRDLPVGFVGGVADAFSSQLREVAAAEGYQLGPVLHSPLG